MDDVTGPTESHETYMYRRDIYRHVPMKDFTKPALDVRKPVKEDLPDKKLPEPNKWGELSRGWPFWD
jgi:hypothetical protein